MRSTPRTMIAGRRCSGGHAILSPDGLLLATPGQSHTVLVLDATMNALWLTYYGHQAGVYRRVTATITALAWLRDGSRIASGSSDGSIHLWHAPSGVHRRTLAQPHEDCTVLALSLCGERCLTALRGRDITTWQLN